MFIELDEAKNYLRVDSDEDDALIETLIKTSQKLCLDILRDDSEIPETVKTAMLYATAYLYEHREEADHRDLISTLKYLLYSDRKEVF